MEKRDKIIIAGLIIVIIALIAGIAYMFIDNGLSLDESTVSDGMQRYNFDSVFTMEVPNNAKFLKEFNNSESAFGHAVSYLDKHNKFAVSYMYSPIITHEFIETFANETDNTTLEFDGDLIIAHNLKNNGKIGKNIESSNFTDTVLIQRGHEAVAVQGNDIDLIKSMIKTLEWYE